MLRIVTYVRLDTNASELCYRTHALQDSTVLRGLVMILSLALWGLLVTELVWLMRVNVRNVQEASIVRQLAELLRQEHVRKVGIRKPGFCSLQMYEHRRCLEQKSFPLFLWTPRVICVISMILWQC